MPGRFVSSFSESVGSARRFSGTFGKITRVGTWSARSTSILPSTSITVPLFTDRTFARRFSSAPVAGLILTSSTYWPTAFSINLAGVRRSKSKFCSRISISSERMVTLCGNIAEDTPGRAMDCVPLRYVTSRTSSTSVRPSPYIVSSTLLSAA